MKLEILNNGETISLNNYRLCGKDLGYYTITKTFNITIKDIINAIGKKELIRGLEGEKSNEL